MEITYDDKDTHAINFAKWILAHKDIQKTDKEATWIFWIGLRAMHYTVEELYQMYLKQSGT